MNEEQLYASGVLTPEKHSMLVRDRVKICRIAGISEIDLTTPMSKICGAGEVEFVSKLRKASKVHGLYYMGAYQPTVLERMKAIAAAFTRNYVDARVMTSATAVAYSWDTAGRPPTVLLVPDYCTALEGVKPTSAQVATLRHLLLNRCHGGYKTVIAVDSQKSLRAQYGQLVQDQVMTSFAKVE